MQQMHPLHRGAAALQKGRHMKCGIEGTEGLLKRLRLQHAMAAQGGITATHQQYIRALQGFRPKRLI